MFIATGNVSLHSMNYNGPSQQAPHYFPIDVTPANLDLSGTPFQAAYMTTGNVIFNQGDPQPIVMHFNVPDAAGTGYALNYIVVGVNA